MKISPSENPRSQLNLTPLIDVVFLLLIFFMVSTTFEKQAKLQIELPEASAEPSQQQSDPLMISISQKGVFFVNNNELLNPNADTLRQAVVRVAGEDRNLPVIIRADANAAHKHVVTAMDVLGNLGFESVSMATTQSKGQQ